LSEERAVFAPDTVQIAIAEADRLRGGQAANLIGYFNLTRVRLAIENGEENLIDDKKKLH
jgi:hypothetical protein